MRKESLTYNDMLDYPVLDSREVEIFGKLEEDGLSMTDMAVATPFGFKRTARLIKPESGENLAAALFIHWYEPGEPGTSNRFQFVEEAKELARKGTICLCVETLWSDLDFFYKRTQGEDKGNSLREIIILRRFLDLLFMQDEIDKTRTLLVGHDFGGMYGMLLGSIDQRINHYVIMAATAKFPDWYLYYPELDESSKTAFMESFDALDPQAVAPNLNPGPVLFQFGKEDPHVPNEKALKLYSEASEPKEIRWYQAGHGLNAEARQDRIRWIKELLFP